MLVGVAGRPARGSRRRRGGRPRGSRAASSSASRSIALARPPSPAYDGLAFSASSSWRAARARPRARRPAARAGVSAGGERRPSPGRAGAGGCRRRPCRSRRGGPSANAGRLRGGLRRPRGRAAAAAGARRAPGRGRRRGGRRRRAGGLAGLGRLGRLGSAAAGSRLVSAAGRAARLASARPVALAPRAGSITCVGSSSSSASPPARRRWTGPGRSWCGHPPGTSMCGSSLADASETTSTPCDARRSRAGLRHADADLEPERERSQTPRNALIASRCRARISSSRTPRPSSGARQSTPTLPWWRLWWTSSAAWPTSSSG